MGLEYCALDVQRTRDGYKVRLLTHSDPKGELAGMAGASVRLCTIVSDGGVCRFGIIREDDGFHQTGPAFFAKAGWRGGCGR